MISEIEKNICGFITRLQIISGRFSLMADHTEVQDTAVSLFTRIDKLISMLELLPETTFNETIIFPTVKNTVAEPKSSFESKSEKSTKRKAPSIDPDMNESELSQLDLSCDQIKSEPESFTEEGTDMDSLQLKHEQAGDFDVHDDTDDYDFEDDCSNDENAADDHDVNPDQDGTSGFVEPQKSSQKGTHSAMGNSLKSRPTLRIVSRHSSELSIDLTLADAHTSTVDISSTDKRITANKMHECKICGKRFMVKSSLKRHINIHSPNAPNCSLCGTIFPDEYSLKKHTDSKHRKSVYICDICSKVFRSQSGLRTHERQHNGEAIHTCIYCHKGFLYKTDFVRHVSKHENVKRFTCKICAKKFWDGQTLKRHSAICGSNEKNHQCHHCSKTFKTARYLSEHLKATHTEPQRYQCSDCGERYNHRASLRNHAMKRHPDSKQFD